MSDPGNKPWRHRSLLDSPRPSRRAASAGFTLIELMVVVAIVALAAGLVSLAIRDPQTSRLEQEAMRLLTLLEAARAESRTSGVVVTWAPVRASDSPGSSAPAEADFRFNGLPSSIRLPTRWLDPQTTAELMGVPALILGPEPILVAQRVTLRLGDRRLELMTDGLAPFGIGAAESGP
jgi:general secretion pathway protein H